MLPAANLVNKRAHTTIASDVFGPWTPPQSAEAQTRHALVSPRTPPDTSPPDSRLLPLSFAARKMFQASRKDGVGEDSAPVLMATGSSAGFAQTAIATSSAESNKAEGIPINEMVAAVLPERPLRVTDLDQSEQTASWIKKPLYYTHHRKDAHEQLSQMIRLPAMHRHVQFTASEGASWDCIAENAFQASQKFGEKHGTMVVLLYCVPCNPFHLGDADVLKRARASVETLSLVSVVGALVVPCSDVVLRDRGTAEERRLPFELRRSLARSVLKAAQQDNWVVVDTCLGTAADQTRSEGCMRNVKGSIAPFVSVYARGRLHSKQHDIRVVEVRSEDPIEGCMAGDPFDQLHVYPSKIPNSPRYGPDGMKPGLAAIGTLVVDVPKQSQFDDLIWCAVKNPQERTFFLAMERFCGTGGARMIADWASKRISTRRRKTKLLAN